MLGNDFTLQQAIALHQAGRVAEAVHLYQKIIRKDAKAVGALNLLGIAQFQLGHLPQAAEALRRVVKLNPNTPNVDFNLARVLQALNRLPVYGRNASRDRTNEASLD